MSHHTAYFPDIDRWQDFSPISASAGLRLRIPQKGHAAGLAELVLEADRASIEYDGEKLPEALAEIQAYLDEEGFRRVGEEIYL